MFGIAHAEAGPIGNDGGTRKLVRTITADGATSVLSAGDPGGDDQPICRLPVRPDPVSARRWQQVLRRIYRVEIEQRGPVPHAVVRGVGHRREVVASVPLSTALGLGLLGVPLVIDIGG